MSQGCSQIDVINHGQVQIMRLPEGWVESTTERHPLDVWTMRTFHPQGDSRTRLCLHYRGGPISPASAVKFRGLLEQSPHELSEAELWDIQEVLRDAMAPGAFEKTAASNKDWKGKRVIVLEGRWTASRETSLSIFVDADGTGSQVQEIHYVAPVEDFSKHLPLAQASLESIEWK